MSDEGQQMSAEGYARRLREHANREALNGMYGIAGDLGGAADTIEALQQRCAALEAALKWYADPTNYKKTIGKYEKGSKVQVDLGSKARQALTSSEGAGKCPTCQEIIEDGCEPDGCRDPFCPMLEGK